VLWNGINLVSPLSGQLDFSLVPAGMFDDVTIQTGGSSSVSGNGAIGASIRLDNHMNFNEGTRLGAAAFIGSFGSQFYQVDAQFSNERLGSSTKVLYGSADNDFKFTNNSVFPPETQRRKHNAQTQYGLMQQLHARTRGAGIFSLKLWYQHTDYEVPNPITILRESQAEEKNEFCRVLGGWNISHANVDWNVQTAFIRQDLNYSDPALSLQSLNRYNSFIENVEANFSYRNQSHLTTGLNYTWEQGVVDDFGNEIPVRNRIALFGAYKFHWLSKWQASLSAREEIVNGMAMPFSPALSVKYQADKIVGIFTNISRNYRIPTFNDLYWKGAGAQGNPDLQSETSFNAELGAQVSYSFLEARAVVFSNNVDNWIQWTPGSVQTWTPQNIKTVWCRGIESQLSLNTKWTETYSKLTLQYSFTKSTNQSVYGNGGSYETGKQLILTPIHEASATAELSWRKYLLHVVCSYTGKQYNDSDNTPYHVVGDYLITNLWLRKQLEINGWNLGISGEVNNLFNVEYVARPGYPLPGINYKVGVQFKFNKINHEG